MLSKNYLYPSTRFQLYFTAITTLLFLALLYLYFFHREFLYEKLLDRVFERGPDIVKRDLEYRQWMYSLVVFYLMYFFFNPFCKGYVQEISQRYYKDYPERKLFDMGHEWIPHTTWSNTIVEILITLIFWSVLYLYFFQEKHGIRPLTDLLYLISILIFLRCIFFTVTLLPKSDKKCQHSLLFSSCNDLIFSGHTSKTLILLLVMNHYGLFSPLLQSIYILLFLTMVYFVIASRIHYTIDVLVAIILTYFVYQIYMRGLSQTSSGWL
jgi:hypothetical protein